MLNLNEKQFKYTILYTISAICINAVEEKEGV